MARLKFELFITHGDDQLTVEVGERPILFGSGGTCDIQMGSGEPTIRAMIQKEGNHLNVKIFDINHPVAINGKKYKSAKIKKSVFFKIGEADIITNVEEIADDVVSELPKMPSIPDDTLPEFKDENITRTHDNLIQKKVEKVETPQITSEPSIPHVDEPVVSSEGQYPEDGFWFDIKFDENKFENQIFQKYEDKNYDYTSYIELFDESVKRLPIPEIHKESKTSSIHIVHSNNGTVLNETFYPVDAKKIFMSSRHDRGSYMQVHDCESNKLEFVFLRNKIPFVASVDGFNAHRVVDGHVVEMNESSVQLSEGQKVVLSKGTSQIVVQLSKTPPKIKTNRFFNVEEDLLKSVALCWAFVSLFIGSILVYEQPKQVKIVKEKVVLLKRKKKNEVVKPEPVKKIVEAQSSAAEKKTLEKKPEVKKVEKQVVKTQPIVKPKKVAPIRKKVKRLLTRGRLLLKRFGKEKELLGKMQRELSLKTPKSKPKKKIKFSFGSSLSSKTSSFSKSNLKVAKSQANVRNLANSVSSSTSISNSVGKSGRFGKTNRRVGKFAAGGRSGFSKRVGARGLSGKSRSVTAYISANTKILGAIDPNLIRKLMREFIPEFRRCYQRELVKNPSVAGVFDLAFQINSRGKGTNVRVKSNGKGFSRKGRGCIKRVVSLIKFPKPKGGGRVDVKQPMNFFNQ